MKRDLWQIQDIDHVFHMVALVCSTTPTIKRFGVPGPIDGAEVVGEHLLVHCASGVTWAIRISDGSRRKLSQYPG